MSPASTTLPTKAEVRWRASVGGHLTGLWHQSPESADNQLLVIFGSPSSDRPLDTPLVISVKPDQEDPGDELRDQARQLWSQRSDIGSAGVYNFSTGLRLVIATSTPISPELMHGFASYVRAHCTDFDFPPSLM